MSVVTIVGAGMMGTALCWPLADNGHEIRLVGTHLDEEYIQSIRQTRFHPKMQREVPANVIPYSYTEIPQAVAGADVLVCGVSSFGVDWYIEKVSPYFRPDLPVLSITKGLIGLENGDLLIVPDYIRRNLPAEIREKISINAVGGPVISHELAARRHTGTVYCGRDAQVLEMLRKTFATDYYQVRTSTDMIGVEVCAAMKNAYAMGVSMPAGTFEKEGSDGLARMFNPQAALFGESMLEMWRLVRLLGGQEYDLVVLAGSGDLYVTVFAGRTSRLGRLLGQGISFAEAKEILAGETLESVEIISRVVEALPKLEARGLVSAQDFPLLKRMYDIIHHGASADLPWESFFPSNLGLRLQ